MKLIKNINNSFNSIFEKKTMKVSKEILEDNFFYDKILEKTVAFRNDFLEKPKSFLKATVNKKMKFPFIALSIFGAVLSLGGYFIINMPTPNAFRGLIIVYECMLSLALVVFIVEIFKVRKGKKLFIDSINNISSTADLLNTPKIIFNNLQTNLFKGLFYKNKEEFESSLNTISNYKNLSKEDLDLFLKSFNKEELNFISSFLFEKFNEDKIEAVVLDDLIVCIKNNKINEVIEKENKFKSLMSKYIETEEISNKQLLKALL